MKVVRRWSLVVGKLPNSFITILLATSDQRLTTNDQ